MMDDRERRLGEILAGLPGPDPQVTDRARRLALAALSARRPSRRILALTALTVAAAAGGARLPVVPLFVVDLVRASKLA